MSIDEETLEKMKQLNELLKIEWREPNYLVQALTHSSYAHENKNISIEHNQRLEFLGDAVLELAVSDFLYRKYPEYPEGALTKVRAGVVCESSLAAIARQLHLGEFMLMGRGEERSGGRQRPSILADVMESLIGAIYLDRGMEVASHFILEKLDAVMTEVAKTGGITADYKTQLQELVQQTSENRLSYRIIEEHGPDHCKTFVAAVGYKGIQWGLGSGRTKKEAEQAAAKVALGKIESGEVRMADGEVKE